MFIRYTMNDGLLQIKSIHMCSLTESALDPALRVEHVRLSKKEVFDQCKTLQVMP